MKKIILTVLITLFVLGFFIWKHEGIREIGLEYAHAAAQKITDLTALTTTPASGDLFLMVDVSDTTMAGTGTNKKITWAYLFGGLTSTELDVLDGATMSTSDLNIIDGISDSGSLTAAELLYVDGVSSAIQTQLDAKLPAANPTFTGTLTVGSAGLTETELEIIDGATLGTGDLNIIDGIADSGSLTAAELLYVDGVTSAIQTQLDAKEGTLTNEAGLYSALSDVSLFLEDLVDDTTPQLGGPLDFNNKVLYDDWTALGDADTTPNVSAGSFFKTANSGATTISDFDDTDDHGDFQDGRLLVVWVDDANTTFDFTSSELTWASQGANDYAASEDDHFIFKFDNSADQWYVVSGPMPSVVSISTLKLPNGTDPDLTAEGQISHDTDGANVTGDETLRGYDGTNQYKYAGKLKTFQATIIAPNDLADATRDACLIWSNETGMTFTVTQIKGWSDTDDTTLNVEEEDQDGQNNSTINALEIATDGTGMYYETDTAMSGTATVEAGHLILLDFDDTDDPGWVKVSITGWFNSDVD